MSARFPALDTPRYVLGEGPAWHAPTGTLSWVDIDDGLVLSAPFDGERIGPVRTRALGGVVGCAVPLDSGRFLVALEAWIGVVDEAGALAERSRALLGTNQRFNDGKIDPQGRFVVGSLRRQGGADGRQVLLRLEHDGAITTLDDDLDLANGLGWSPDGEVLYSIDSARRVVYARRYGERVGPRSVLVEVDGMPDGMTVDDDGNLWITVIDGCAVRCHRPDGTLVPERTIDLGRLHPASAEFAGPALDRLVITTGFPRLEYGADHALRSPSDGAVIVAVPGSRGLPPTPWSPVPLPG